MRAASTLRTPERLLFEAGAIDAPGRVDDGTTRADSMDLERRRSITIRAAVTSFAIDDLAVTIIDTPGQSGSTVLLGGYSRRREVVTDMSPRREPRKPVQSALEVCPVEVAVAVLGGAWKLTLVKHLMDRTLRFGELGRRVPAASARTLTRQLRDLEQDGIIRREVYAEVPSKVEYSRTDLGRSLAPLVELMDRWGEAYARHLHEPVAG